MSNEPEASRRAQPYDSSFKGLVDDQKEPMLSFFLGKPVIEAQELNEALLKQDTVQAALRVDAAYLITEREWQRICRYVAHLEFETNPTLALPRRLVRYFGLLYYKHDLPIQQVVVCPFVCGNVPVPPLSLSIGNERITEHHYRVVSLWEHPVDELLDRECIELYALLPTMKGATAEVLIAALGQMRAFYEGDEHRFLRHLLWLDTFLKRTTMVPQDDKERTWQAMSEFESLLDEGYFVQKRVAEATARGKAEGKALGQAEGEARGKALGQAEGKALGEAIGLQEALVTVIELRFPSLLDEAQHKVEHVKTPETLKLLVQGLKRARNEDAARALLDLLEAA